MADLESIYDKRKSEYVLYISLGGRARTSHFSLFKDGILVAECNCITGDENKGQYTPLGVHSVSKKSKSRNGDGYTYYDCLWLKIKGKNSNYAVQSLLDFGERDIGNQTLGSHASNGSIRLPFEFAKWLRKNIDVGTYVIIDDRNYQPSSIGYKNYSSK
jgi:lipoprotein-anchoring transpeptidase ErfK/SrfK